MSLPRYPLSQFTVSLFRRVFGRDSDSRAVLAMMLNELGFYSADAGNDLERGQQEYAKRLLTLCGAWHPKNTRAIVDAMLDKVPERYEEPKAKASNRDARDALESA